MEKSELLILVNEGLSIREIARKVGFTPTPVRYWLKKHGLKTKNTAEFPRRWTDEELANALAKSKTKAEVLRRLGLSVRGGNYETINKHISRLELDTEHLSGKGHGSGGPRGKPLSEWLVKNSTIDRKALKRRLIKEGLLINECTICPVIGMWRGKSLVMVLDHINGDPLDNRLSNLRMLCPNCNSQQETFSRGKKGLSQNNKNAEI